MAVSVRQLIGSANPLFFTQALGNFNLKQYVGDGATVNFAVTPGLFENGVIVTENGVLQMPVTDYTVSGATLTFVTAPAENVQIQIREVAFTNMWTEVTVNTVQAVRGQKLLVNTAAQAVTVILPAFPVIGDQVTVVDATGTADANNITVARNANRISGLEENLVIATASAETNLVYYNATVGWVVSEAGGSGGGTGVTAYATIAELPLAGNDSGSMAFVEQNNRLYIWTGVGWFNIALINTNPTISQGPNPTYAFATDGTPIVITLVAEDPEGIPIVFSAQVTSGTLGNTAVITQNNNIFTITPSTNEDDVGTFGVTFTASDGVNIATAVSSFTLVFAAADDYYNQSILLTTSSENNANNNTFVDSSSNNFAITRTGNTTQGTFGPYSPAGWSGYFDGAGDELTIANNAAFNLGTGDFTAECWFNISANSTANADGNRSGFLFGPGQLVNAAAWMLEISGNSTTTGAGLVFQSRNSSGTPTPLSYSFTFAKNTWYHAAASKVGNTLALFVNGQKVAENTNWTVLTDSGGSLFRIGRRAISANYEHYFNGYISNIRVIKGIGLYTANFTPSTEPLTAIANTGLLTLQDNRFIDRSTNNFAITRVGDTRITAFSPFLPTEQYDPATHGGSAYFDGVGDTLKSPTSAAFAFGTGNFTVEFWLFYRGGIGYRFFWNLNGGSDYIGYGLQNGTTTPWLWQDADIAVGNTNITPNTWQHHAVVRSNGVIKIYLDGIEIASASYTTNFTTNKLICIAGNGVDNTQDTDGIYSNFRVVKGTAVYTTNFTPPTAPLEPVADTSLLLNFTNAGIFDETGKVVLETVGDARVSTSVVKYGDTSMAFDGSGDYLQLRGDEPIGTANFTIEGWFYLSSIADNYYNLFLAGLFGIRYGNSGFGFKLQVGYDLNTFGSIYSCPIQTVSNQNQWAHIAWTRAAGTNRLFFNGVQQSLGTGINPTSYSVTSFSNSTSVAVGGRVGTGWNGYIQDFRITTGTARYTATFTPPTQQLGYTNPE